MKLWNWVVVIAVLLGSIAIPASAQEPPESKEPEAPQPVMIRSSLDPETSVYMGQKVRVYVDVMTNTWFTKAPEFPELRIPHAICLELSKFGTNFTTRIDGQTYAVQRKEYVVYPQRPERYAVPSLAVNIVYARPGESPGEATLNSLPLEFEAIIPEQAKGLDYFVTTPRLQVREEYDRPIENLKVGDSFTRTITMVADDSVGMLLPPVDFGEVEGLGTYPASPRMEDESNRGVYTGKRTDSVTYVLEKEGEYTLPEITIHWFDIQNEQLKQEVLPAIEFSVVTNPDLEPEMLSSLEEEMDEETEKEIATARKRQINLKGLFYLFLSLVAVVAALWIFLIPYLKRFIGWWKIQKKRKAESERAYFKNFHKACRKGDPHSIMKTLMAWLDRAYAGPQAATLEWFIAQAEDPELEKQAKALKAKLYEKAKPDREETDWSPKYFYKSILRAKKSLREKKQRKIKQTDLQPLNP